jgi:hypothetical protein
MTIPSQDLKICTKCGQTKVRFEFYTRKRRNEVSSYCKECTRKLRYAYVHSDRWKEIRRRDNISKTKHRNRLKEAAFAAYGGYRCACCGETEKAFLTIDHIDNNGSSHRKSLGGRTAAGVHTYRWLVRHNFPEGFQVLCMNCNWGKRMNGICPHKVRCNDQTKVVGPSGPKRIAPDLHKVEGEDMVSSALKNAVALN